MPTDATVYFEASTRITLAELDDPGDNLEVQQYLQSELGHSGLIVESVQAVTRDDE